jgi:hypothetical protein
LRFDISTLGTDLQNWGFHYTTQCGNDVIEGATPVPEPAAMLLHWFRARGACGIQEKVQESLKKRIALTLTLFQTWERE